MVVKDDTVHSRLWSARREMSPAVRALSKHKLSEDIVVPRQRIADLLDQVARTSETTGIRTLTYGHAGDGNLHVNFLWDDPAETQKAERCVEQLFGDVVAMGGKVSDEHSIGLPQVPYPS